MYIGFFLLNSSRSVFTTSSHILFISCSSFTIHTSLLLPRYSMPKEFSCTNSTSS
ncbi:hypothetical protein BLGI_710 [Brevibacillus laterosporus GI-9]|nr:hypothetical protein BLGI_710 [Brevibacillus laterosporus GI-9]